ncbi:(d)CMP kinase [Rarobacter incanus]|uniref:Cytidylate kinase n=1 Tax=Rarobacter incanus TaxID=153494 RepID=A0A542SN78_9MICO|nr:(d)CMP kinase [Rarobacter incanus]TQK75707.1 cytidylate kinase [Rarobacter incanus]
MTDAATDLSLVHPLSIAIDGPSGSGKSSVSKAVARSLGLAYLDTGAMYRAATLWVMGRGIALDDQVAVARAVKDMPLVQVLDPVSPGVELDGIDVADAIRSADVTTNVSKVATNLDVRGELRARQRAIIDQERATGGFSAGRGIVAEGRDITTVVAPDADVRILLTASEEARLARRSLEVNGTANKEAVDSMRDQVVRRDRDDSTVTQFTVAADGVVTLDSSDLDFDQTVAAALRIVAKHAPARPVTP